MTKFDKGYFVKKFEAISDENYIQANLGSDGCHCALGHCGVKDDSWKHTEESKALTLLFNPEHEINKDEYIRPVNPVIRFFDNIPKNKPLKKAFLKKLKNL